MQPDDVEPLDVAADDDGEVLRMSDWDQSAAKLNGAERLVRLLRGVTGFMPPAPKSKVEGWQRIAVTPDIELSIRAEFDANQLEVFRELTDLLRYLLQQTNALSGKGDE